MSYKRTYTGYVYYSGSVSYPPSEHGGSVSYSGSEPVHVTIDVDTAAFDASVDNCNGALHGLQAAVVATEAAQIDAKVKASKKVSDAVIKGFFDYVGADLSQKIKELSSITESKFIELMDQKKTCMTKTDQMREDYQRITKRYSNLFQDLDKEMVSRIELLDRPTFNFEAETQAVVDRKSDSELLGISTVSANENIQLETVLSCSHLKRAAGELLNRTNAYLRGVSRLASSVRDMLSPLDGDAQIYLPVMYVESVQDAAGNAGKVYGLDSVSSAEAVRSNLMKDFRASSICWDGMDKEEKEYVDSYVNSYIREGLDDERIQRTMLNLLGVSDVQTIK